MERQRQYEADADKDCQERLSGPNSHWEVVDGEEFCVCNIGYKLPVGGGICELETKEQSVPVIISAPIPVPEIAPAPVIREVVRTVVIEKPVTLVEATSSDEVEILTEPFPTTTEVTITPEEIPEKPSVVVRVFWWFKSVLGF